MKTKGKRPEGIVFTNADPEMHRAVRSLESVVATGQHQMRGERKVYLKIAMWQTSKKQR